MADHHHHSGEQQEVLSLSSGTVPALPRRRSRRLKKSGSLLHLASSSSSSSSDRSAKSEDSLPRVPTTSSSTSPYSSGAASYKSNSGRDIVVRDRRRLVEDDDDDDSQDEDGTGHDAKDHHHHHHHHDGCSSVSGGHHLECNTAPSVGGGKASGGGGKLKLFDSIRMRRPRRKDSLSSLSFSLSRSGSGSSPSSSSSHPAVRSCSCCAGVDACDNCGGGGCGQDGDDFYDSERGCRYANDTLPYEVLLHVFGHLSMKELGVVCVVCRFWKEASEADCLWKSITLSLWGGLGLRDVQRAAATTGKSLSTKPSSTSQLSSSSSSSSALSCPSSPAPSSSAPRPSSSSSPSSPVPSPKPPRKRSLLGLLGSGSAGGSLHTSSEDLVAAATGDGDKTQKSRSSGEHGGGHGVTDAQVAADYLSSFSTLKDLYRHEFERRQRRGEDEYRIVVVGASGVDKSAICVRFVQGSLMLTKYDPTAEESYRVRRKVDGLPCMYDIMDTAGQMEYSALRDQYLKSGHGFLLVYSVTSPASFQALEKLRLQILRIKEDSTVPIVFLGSHADRESQRQVSQDEALFLAEKLNCGWLECSAKTGQNVNDAFELIVRMINRWRALHPNWNTPKSRQEANMKNRVKKKILFWRETRA